MLLLTGDECFDLSQKLSLANQETIREATDRTPVVFNKRNDRGIACVARFAEDKPNDDVKKYYELCRLEPLPGEMIVNSQAGTIIRRECKMLSTFMPIRFDEDSYPSRPRSTEKTLGSR